MRQLFIIGVLTLFSATAFGQKTYTINQFYNKYGHEKNVINVKLPGWLIRFAGAMGTGSMDDDEGKDALKKFVKKLKGLRMIVTEDANPIPADEMNRLMEGVKQQDFEDLFKVRSKGVNVNFMVKERGGKIRNLFMVVHEENTFVMMSLKMKLKLEDIAEFINEMMKDNADLDIIDVEEVEEEKAPPPQV